MAAVTNNRKVWSVAGKVTRKIENGKKKADMCREFGLVNSMIRIFVKTEPKLLVLLNRKHRESSYFESLNEVMSMKHCLSGFSNTVLTGDGSLLVTIFFLAKL
jgi:hypothetical protein